MKSDQNFQDMNNCVCPVLYVGGEMKKYQTDILKKFYIDVYDLWFCLWDYAIKIVMNDNAMSYYSRGFCVISLSSSLWGSCFSSETVKT